MSLKVLGEPAPAFGPFLRAAAISPVQSFPAPGVAVVATPSLLHTAPPLHVTVALVDENAGWPDALWRHSADAIVSLDSGALTALSARFNRPTFSPADTLTDVVDAAVSQPLVVIGTSVRFRRRAELWGDTHFARDLAEAVGALGYRTRVTHHGGAAKFERLGNVSLIYLRGLRPAPATSIPTVVWVISHPSSVEASELDRAAAVFSASSAHAERVGGLFLPQATNPHRFFPGAVPAEVEAAVGGRVLFVGNSRGQHRPSLQHAIDLGLEPVVYGRGWGRVRGVQVAGLSIANDRLRPFYTAAGVVLNDHWPDMVQYEILSNRVFDVAASGGRIVSDMIPPNLAATFSGQVGLFSSRASLAAAVETMQNSEAPMISVEAGKEQANTFAARAKSLATVLAGETNRP